MTQKEKEQRLGELKILLTDHSIALQMLEDERRALEATPVQEGFKVWVPGHKESYYDSAMVRRFDNNSDTMDKPVIEAGLSHPTKEAAERHHQFLVMLHGLHKFAVEHNQGWKPDWEDTHQGKWAIGIEGADKLRAREVVFHNWSILPYFESEELAQKAIDAFGDRLKILFEYYNS
jgi:hypothetical protein